MKILSRGLIVVLVIAVVVPMLFLFLFKRILPTEIGVKQVLVGSIGVVPEDHAGGFHLGITGLHRWYELPRATHFLHFVGDRERDTATTLWEPPLNIRTKDNNETEIDCTVPYRIRDGEAHLIVSIGLRNEYRSRVKETVKKVLREQLAQLTSEDWQETETRLARIAMVMPMLNTELAKFHCEAQDILIRAVTFQSEYEAKLQEKQYLTQKANLDRAQTAVADEEKVTNSIEKQIGAAEAQLTAEWDKKFQAERSRYDVLISEIAAQAKVYEARTRSAADADYVKLLAEGQLALDKARALRDALRNEALRSEGGRVFLALQAAQNLKIPSVTLNSNDPRVPLVMDLDALTSVLLGSGAPAGGGGP